MVFNGIPLALFCKGDENITADWEQNKSHFRLSKVDSSVYNGHTQIINQEMQNVSMQRACGHDMT